jgi:hypothetical protein
MKKQLTLNDVIAMLKKRCEEAGSQRAFALDSKISPQYITDVLRRKREPGQMVLDALGLEKVTTYREKESL